MKSVKLFFSTVALTLLSTQAFAQHSDVEFGYDDLSTPASFVFDADDVTSEGFFFFESEMEELDPFDPDNFSSDEPGFATNGAEGLLVNPDDQIFLNAVDASAHSLFGVGFVNYINPTTMSDLEASGRIGVLDNSGSTEDLILNGASIESGGTSQFIGLADSDGDIHDHVIVDLLDDSTAPLGAYGIMFQLQSDFADADGDMDLDSDPFWIIWNHGLSEDEFENQALQHFGVSAVPEPGSTSMLAIAFVSALMARRRKKLA